MAKQDSINLNRLPKKPTWYLKPIYFGGSLPNVFLKRVKFNKINFEGIKWPFLIVSSHASMLDFEINARFTFPHATSYICSIEEFISRESLLRGIGAFPKRKFTKDIRVVKNALTAIKKQNNSVTIYAEARYSLIGINERIDHSIGKLAKVAGVPVIVLINHGDFLFQPQWDKKHKRHTKFVVDAICIANQEEVKLLSAEEIQDRLEKAFVFDDYQWQYDNRIKIKSKYRANNLHKVLYRCPHCEQDYVMRSKGTELWCSSCGAHYIMDELGQIHCLNMPSKFHHVPDWYRYEKEEVKKEVENGTYHFEDEVRLEHLENSRKGFVQIGKKIHFVHDMNGLHLHGQLDDGSSFDFDNPPIQTPSIHIEYDFKKRGTVKRGQAIDINTEKDTWFIYPSTQNECLTKIHFATEALYDKVCKEKNIK